MLDLRGRWRRVPLRIRLVAGFAAAMLVVLAGAGTFVYLRVQYALDLRLDEDLTTQSTALTATVHAGALPADPAGSPFVVSGGVFQVLDAGNHVLAASPGLPAGSLLDRHQFTAAQRGPVRADRGTLLPISTRPLRIYAVPVTATTPAGPAAVAVVAVRRDQRDEALRELIGQLALANLAALAVASLVGYRLTRAALAPVERYRTQAAAITAGATDVRLAVPDSDDEIARLGRTLNDMLSALDTALQRERRFVQDASHELRTPLTLLATELELALRRPRSTAELEATVRAAAADTADLIALTGALLAVGGQPAIDLTDATADPATPTVHLGELLAGMIERYRATTGTDPIALRLPPSGGPFVRGDPVRLRRAVTNLLDNAARHGAPPITVTAEPVDNAIRLTIHDTGPGMAAAFLPHATDRFTRADTARTTPGTGLGLALVAAIIDAHHGHLRICSNHGHHHTDQRRHVPCPHPGEGTTVTVLLPAVRPDQAP
jgi:signal transduction histidine kinase